MWTNELLEYCRNQFPALRREIDGRPIVYFDGPAGTQVPQCVIDAVRYYYSHNNANHDGLFPTARDSDAMLAEAHRAMADLLGAEDPDTVYFGPNMTMLTFALSRALAKTWQPGDELVVTRLDHDANVTPWVLAAQDAGATVRYVDFRPEDCTLDLEDFRAKITDRTRLVAVGCASNSVGSINPVVDICRWAREAGALSFLDSVHFTPHSLVDVAAFECDFLACSAYKFFGPHVGAMWGRRELLEELSAYKVRPAPDSLPGKWMTGTQNHEGIAGTLAAIDYLAGIGRQHAAGGNLDRRAALHEAYAVIGDYEQQLVTQLIVGLADLDDVRIWGITDPERFSERLPTLSITHAKKRPEELAQYLGECGICVWQGNYYALQLTETLELEPDGMVRVGLVHYNTAEEVSRLLEALADLSNA